MSSTGSLLDTIVEALEARAVAPTDEPLAALGFRAWMSNEPKLIGLLHTRLEPLLTDDVEIVSYLDVAALGYGCAILQNGETERHAAFFEGATWMRGRQFFRAGRPWAFEVDGMAVLGVALGIQVLSPLRAVESECHWLQDLITQCRQETSPDAWTLSLLLVASAILTDPKTQQLKPERGCLPTIAAALAAKGWMNVADVDEEMARQCVLDPTAVHNLSAEQAVTHLKALHWLFEHGATMSIERPSVNDVVTLLRRVPHALKRWPWEDKPRTKSADVTAQRWDAQHEYHVQSLIWALLAPMFQDLEDEEWLRSLGHKHPRADMAIPSLQLIVEIKFARVGSQAEWAKLINEVSADVGLYLAPDSTFTQLVPFVWDHSRSSDQHQELDDGFCRLKGVPAAVVVSRPGRWKYKQG